MSVPVPSTVDICNGISAYGATSTLMNRLEMLNDYLLLWQEVVKNNPEKTPPASMSSLHLMVEDVFDQAGEVQKLLEPFTAYIR